MTNPSANKPKTSEYYSISEMMALLTVIRTDPLEKASNQDTHELPILILWKVPVKKSPMGLFKMPEPTQSEDALLE